MQITLMPGAQGGQVRAARLLMGYGDGEYFDAEFAAYVKAWQKDNTLAPDGTVGPETWRALAARTKTVSLQKNARGPEALALQLFLANVKADGRFGSETRAALKRFQQTEDLTADGTAGPAVWRRLLAGEKAKEDLNVPDFKQYDARWAGRIYSSCGNKKQTMRSSGCGPAAMADIAAVWWDENTTPWELAQRSLSWGTRTRSSGTAGAFFARAAKWYGAGGFIPGASASAARDCLKTGGLAIVCFGKSRWTGGGHYCCLWRYADGTFFIRDPASAQASRAKGRFEEVRAAAKRFYCFWK